MPKRVRVSELLAGEAAHAQLREPPENGPDAEQPGGLDADAPPGARVVEGGVEQPGGMGERQEVADPPGERYRLTRDEAEEDDRQHDEHREQRRRARLAGKRAEQ